jgi:hypothetical protein
MNRIDKQTRVLSDNAIFYTHTSPSLGLLRERGFPAPQDTSLCESMFGRTVVARQLLVSKENIHKRAGGFLLGTCVTSLPMPYPEITSARVPQIRSSQGCHAFMIRLSIEMNARYQVIISAVRSSWPDFLSRGYFAPSVPSKARSSVLGACSIAPHAAVKCAVRARGLACITAGRYAQKSERGLSYLERDADIRDCASW